MKKVIIFLFIMFIMPLYVDAANIINDINVNISILEDGSANITEIWDVDGSDGTEWYKVMNNLGNSQLSNFKVVMDGEELTYKNWIVDESLEQKKGYYGINYTNDGMELCFGKYDYNRHQFTLTYTLSNFIFNTVDNQVLYWNLIDKLSNVDFRNFSIVVDSYYEFPLTLDVWGYGYMGRAYVENGKIKMNNVGNMGGDDYVVLLAKFPLNTFNTTNYSNKYYSFDDVYKKAEENTFDYHYNNSDKEYYDNEDDKLSDDNSKKRFVIVVLSAMSLIVIILFNIKPKKTRVNLRFGYKDDKIIDKENVPLFRDIPCNKNIYYANALLSFNDLDYNKSNILGAVILKWVRENKILFKSINDMKKKKNVNFIDLTLNPVFDNNAEKTLFDIMYEASNNGILEVHEFEKWCKKNCYKFLNVLDLFIDNERIEMTKNKLITNTTFDKNCKYFNILDDSIYEDSVKLYGFKKYLVEFSNMKEKDVIEVHLWDEYLMFAFLFGIADKVFNQFMNMYPEFLEQNIDYNMVISVDVFSKLCMIAVNKGIKRYSFSNSSSSGYSAGGGGFSSGGGGGGSFGGGGGGSR